MLPGRVGTLEERTSVLAISSLHEATTNERMLYTEFVESRASSSRCTNETPPTIYKGIKFFSPGPAMKHVFNTLLFTILVPATVAGWIPRTLRGDAPLTSTPALRWLSFALIAIGIAIYLHTAFWGFALRGLGTPAPIAPPGKLVAEGLHRYVRNPMYLGVLMIVIGQAVLYRSMALVEYSAAIWLAAHLFVLLYEEPTLQRKFGEEYREYRRRVPRWIPRF